MAVKRPGKPDHVLAITELSEQWLRCPLCGRNWFWVECVVYIQINIKCPSCGKIIEVAVGVGVERDH